MNYIASLFVAEYFGVILGVGATRDAAAQAAEAAAAGIVSRVEVRTATPAEVRLWGDGRLGHTITRLKIDGERALLEAIRTDITRAQWAADHDVDGVRVTDNGLRTPEFPEYSVINTFGLSDVEYGELCDMLEDRLEDIQEALDELRVHERQMSLFEAVA